MAATYTPGTSSTLDQLYGRGQSTYKPTGDAIYASNPTQTYSFEKGSGSDTLPDWLKPNGANDNIQELLDSYGNIPQAFDPSDQVATLQNIANWTTSQGKQAANSAGREFAARTAQAGGTGSGAGVVRAQALLPFLRQTSEIKANAAEVEADARQKAASLSGQIASTIGQLRNDYTKTLATFIANRETISASMFKDSQDRELEWSKLNEAARVADMQNRISQASIYASMPNVSFYTDGYGRVVPGGQTFVPQGQNSDPAFQRNYQTKKLTNPFL